jgi:septal ring factor EnvC (AmiA/AmiB activator)
MPRMKPLAPLLAAAILVLCFFSYEQKARIDQQAKAIADLSKEVAENKKTRNSFEYQERCSEQARKSFADLGYKEKKWPGMKTTTTKR